MVYPDILVDGFLNLPHEILDLVFGYIPTRIVLTYTSIPIINDFAYTALNSRKIEVDVIQKLHNRYLLDRPVIDENELDLNSLGINDGNLITLQCNSQEDQVSDFIKLHPRLKPEVLIVGTELLLELYNKTPHWFEQTRKLSVFKLPSENDDEAIERLQSFDCPIQEIGAFGVIKNQQLPPSVTKLEVHGFSALFNLAECGLQSSNLTELRITDHVMMENLKYLPKGLKTLEIGVSRIGSRSKHNFPPNLELLQVSTTRDCFKKKFNILKLKNLKHFTIQRAGLKTLANLKLPKKIQSLELVHTEITSLDTIEQYKYLKNLRLYVYNEAFSGIVNCKFPDSLEQLTFSLPGHTSTSKIGAAITRLERGLGLQPIQFPSKLKVLKILVNDPLFSPQEWIFPESLTILSLKTPVLPTKLKFPPNLMYLSICGYLSGYLPQEMPKSLVRLKSSLLPPRNDSLKELYHLTHLCFDFTNQPIASFDWELPENLRELTLKQGQLKSLKLDAPCLMEVKISLNSFTMLQDFTFPDSLAQLKFEQLSNYTYTSEFQITSQHKLPPNLEILEMPSLSLDTQSFNNLNLRSVQRLKHLDLRDNKIEELANEILPDSIEALSLQQNGMKRIGSKVFKNMSRLRVLHLDNNNLNFDLNHPVEIPLSVEYLYLSNNKLNDPEGLTFGPESRMELLQMTKNEFEDTTDAQIKIAMKLNKTAAVLV